MSIHIWRGGDAYNSTASSSVECLKNEEMQILLYTLQDKESINIVPDDYDVTSTIIVLSGGIRIHSTDEMYELQAPDMVMLVNIACSYYVEALGPAKIIAVSSEANQDAEEDEAIVSMLADVENKDVYTLGHSRRVSLYAKRLALSYESTYNVISLSAAACMHDVGKINVPIEILQKPGKLTDEEFDLIKLHPADSYTILKDALGERAAKAARQHHERLDGSGYPDGLRGEDICMDARIIAIADVFDAMTCKRIYNQPLPPIRVVEMLEGSPDKYDASIVAILRRKVENGDMDDVVTSFIAKE